LLTSLIPDFESWTWWKYVIRKRHGISRVLPSQIPREARLTINVMIAFIDYRFISCHILRLK